MRVEGNLQRILALTPKSGTAMKIPWVGALRTFAATAAADPDGLSIDFQLGTQGALGGASLPLAPGPTSPPAVKRPGEIATALRNPAQIARFFEQAALSSDPRSLRSKTKVQKALGVNIDRDLLGQLGGDSAASFALDGSSAARVDLKNPTAFSKTLATALKNLPKAQRASGSPASKVQAGPGGLYAVKKPPGSTAYVGVIGKELVVATDPVRAKEFAVQPASPVAGATGALVISADPKSIADAIIKKSTTGATALLGPTLTGPLKDFTGWVDSESGGLRGHLKLTIR